MSETVATPPKTIEVTAVETIHRTYIVQADNEEQAKLRLRRYFSDPQIFLPGIVEPKGDGVRARWLIRKKK